jgi:hypothetical protein
MENKSDDELPVYLVDPEFELPLQKAKIREESLTETVIDVFKKISPHYGVFKKIRIRIDLHNANAASANDYSLLEMLRKAKNMRIYTAENNNTISSIVFYQYEKKKKSLKKRKFNLKCIISYLKSIHK